MINLLKSDDNLSKTEDNKIKCKPFLRWAGGKTWLIKHLDYILPKKGFNQYHEPFLGGASVFLHLQPDSQAYLSDLNFELIETYQQVKNNVEGVIDKLKTFKNNQDFYYELRDKKAFRTPAANAAKFIFLNQTSFNGIYRVNLKGKYNVPYGFRKKDFFEPVNLRSVSSALKNVKINQGDFQNIIDNIKEKDLVFLDPPYTVSHYNNGFIKYNSKLFSESDQLRLSETINTIKELGAYYILTNAAHPQIKSIFEKSGDKVIELKRASLIGGKKAKRGNYSEYIFTNINQ